VGGPSSLARSDGAIPSMRCVILQPFATGGNRPYLDLWVITATRATRGTRPKQLTLLNVTFAKPNFISWNYSSVSLKHDIVASSFGIKQIRYLENTPCEVLH
jgi:hypothetical protein